MASDEQALSSETVLNSGAASEITDIATSAADNATPAARAETPSAETTLVDVLSACSGVRSQITDLAALIDQQVSPLASLCDRLLMDVNERAEQAKLRETLYEKLDASRPSFQLQLVRPILLRLAAMYDLLQDFQATPDLPDETRRAFQILEAHLRDTLVTQGVELVKPQEGDRFDKSLHYVIKAEPCSDPKQHEAVSRCVVPGFVYLGANERTSEVRPVVIRPARIATWKYEAAAAPLGAAKAEETNDPGNSA